MIMVVHRELKHLPRAHNTHFPFQSRDWHSPFTTTGTSTTHHRLTLNTYSLARLPQRVRESDWKLHCCWNGWIKGDDKVTLNEPNCPPCRPTHHHSNWNHQVVPKNQSTIVITAVVPVWTLTKHNIKIVPNRHFLCIHRLYQPTTLTTTLMMTTTTTRASRHNGR